MAVHPTLKEPTMQRRHFMLSAAAGGLLLPAGLVLADDDRKKSAKKPKPPKGGGGTPPANPKARVIVVGGGMAGATVAKYLRLWGDAVDVTLIERSAQYTSNIMSSMVLTGQRSMASLGFGYGTLQSAYGVRLVTGDVVEIDPVGVRVRLATGAWLAADRIVMAPGIGFDAVPGLDDASRMPHAWQAGPQTSLLAQQLAAMPANGVAVLTIPKVPYRCPPGPYERACLLADWMKAYKPRAKLIVLDANPDFVTERDNFTQAFFGLHANVIEYRTNVEISSVDTQPDDRLHQRRPGAGERGQPDPAAARRCPGHGQRPGHRQRRALRAGGRAQLCQHRGTPRACDRRRQRPPPSPRPATSPTRRPRCVPTRCRASSPAASPIRHRSPTRPATPPSPAPRRRG
jgi:hypothetical protein